MKALKMLGMAAIAVLMAVNLISCNSDELIEENSEYIEVQLGFKKDALIDIIYPETKSVSETDDLYAVQIYYYTSDNTKEPYGYAIFDDPNNIKLRLIKGYTYDFESLLCVDGYNLLQYCGRSYVGGFSEEKVYPTRDTEFTYTERFLSLVNSRLDKKGEGEAYFMQELCLYRGNTNGVEISKSTSSVVTIELELEYISGKLTFNATGLNSGYIKSSGLIKPIKLTPDNPTHVGIYAKGEYGTSSPIDIYYVDEDNMQQLIGSVKIGNIVPKQNITINIKLADSDKLNTQLSFAYDDLDSIVYEDGDSYDLEMQ